MRIMKYVSTINSKLLWYNILLLFFIVLLPFSTAFYVKGFDAVGPFVFYCFNLSAIGFFNYLMNVYVIKKEKGETGITTTLGKYFKLRAFNAFIVWALAGVLAFVFPFTARFLFILLFIFEFILKYLRSYLTAWAGSVFEHNSTMESIDQIITCDLSDYELYGSKEIQSKFNEISKLRSFFGGQALTTVVDFPFSFIFLFVIYMISGRLVIVPAIFFLCVIAIAVYLGRHIRIEMKKKSVNDAKLYKLILESFESIESVKAGGYENHFKKRFQYFSEKSIESNYASINNEYSYTKRQLADLKLNLIHEKIEDEKALIFFKEEQNAQIILNGELGSFLEIASSTYSLYPILNAQLDSIINLNDN